LIRLSTILDNEEIMKYEDLRPNQKLISLLFFKQSCLTNSEVTSWNFNDFVNLEVILNNARESIAIHSTATKKLLTTWLETSAISNKELSCLNSVYELLSDSEVVENKINEFLDMMLDVTKED